MRELKEINIKNWTYYFYHDIIDIKRFDIRLLKINKKSFKNIGIYNIGYITIKKIDDCKSIDSVNPLYLIIDHLNGYNQRYSSGECDYEKVTRKLNLILMITYR